MKLAEMPEWKKEPTTRAATAPFVGGAPANDTAPPPDALSSRALLRLGGALVVAGAAVVVGVLMAAIAAGVGHTRAPA
jgi:hypothetical protein